MTRPLPVYWIKVSDPNNEGKPSHTLEMRDGTEERRKAYKKEREKLKCRDLDFIVPNRGAVLHFTAPTGTKFINAGITFLDQPDLYTVFKVTDDVVIVVAQGANKSKPGEPHHYTIDIDPHDTHAHGAPIHHGGGVPNGGSIP